MATKITPLEVTECYRKVMSKFETPLYTKLDWSPRAYLKLQFIINLVGGYEVTGYGRVKNGKVIDVSIPKQTLTSTTANVDEMSMVDFMSKIPKEQLSEWILDWHSHVEMSTSPSSTDKENYNEQFEARGCQQFIATIVNKKESCWCKCVVGGGRFEDVEVSINDNFEGIDTKELYDECVELVKDNCKKEVTVVVQTKLFETPKTKDKSKSKTKDTEHCQICGQPLREWEHDLCWECKRDNLYALRDYRYGYDYNY